MPVTFLDQVLLEETSGISNATLKDIGWDVKLVMSSDKVSNIKDPMVTLYLYLETENGKKKHVIEMNQSELKLFIESLEGANKTALQLQT